jgi:uncharacterized protein (TIGR03435 family)
MSMAGGSLTMNRASMGDWAGYLAAMPDIGRDVLDQTGLTGKYDFNFKMASSRDGSGPSIFTNLEEQLGLKLVSTRGPVETIVVEHIERPSEN